MPDDTACPSSDERCAVVALTNDPKLDDLALMGRSNSAFTSER
jgi:xanthine/CO dehydrogenase XdhC/CoxF family maturation factor